MFMKQYLTEFKGEITPQSELEILTPFSPQLIRTTDKKVNTGVLNNCIIHLHLIGIYKTYYTSAATTHHLFTIRGWTLGHKTDL